MPVITAFNPELALQQAVPFVAAFDRPEVNASAINPLINPDEYATAVHQLSPRFGTPEERAAAKDKGESGNLARQALAERRASWGNEHGSLVTDVAEEMGLMAVSHAFTDQPGTVVDVAVVVEGANESNEQRLEHVLEAHASGLLVVRRAVLPANPNRKPTAREQGPTGTEAADAVVAQAIAADPNRLYGRSGQPKLEVLVQQALKPNTLTAVSEVIKDATALERAGRWAVSSSAIYTLFMAFEAGAAALRRGMRPDQLIIGGIPATERAMDERAKALNATYGAEIVRTAESAAHLIGAQIAAGLR